jgi:hypothetical protein
MIGIERGMAAKEVLCPQGKFNRRQRRLKRRQMGAACRRQSLQADPQPRFARLPEIRLILGMQQLENIGHQNIHQRPVQNPVRPAPDELRQRLPLRTPK